MKIKVDTVDYTAQVSSARITSGEGDTDFVTFADAAAGGSRQYNLEFTAMQDVTTGTLWDEVFTNAGDTVPVTLIPYGNATPTPAEPHFTMSAIISEPDGDFLGGEADASATARMTFECSWVLTGKPVRVTA
jgi:hypothetical protein